MIMVIYRGLTRGVNGQMRILIRRRELMFRNLPSNTIRYSRLITVTNNYFLIIVND